MPWEMNDPLRLFFTGTYRWLTRALGLAGIVAWCVASTGSAEQVLVETRAPLWVLWPLLGLVTWLCRRWAPRVSSAAAAAFLLCEAVLTGLTVAASALVAGRLNVSFAFFALAAAYASLAVLTGLHPIALRGWVHGGIVAAVGLGSALTLAASGQANVPVAAVTGGAVALCGLLTVWGHAHVRALYSQGASPTRGALAFWLLSA
jgi:FtsH-binding integral membrane protein